MTKIRYVEGQAEPPSISPDRTVLDAADVMERSHGTRVLVRMGDHFLGVLSEEDIVERVLKQGRRPDAVRVEDVMIRGREEHDGSLLLESSPSRRFFHYLDFEEDP